MSRPRARRIPATHHQPDSARPDQPGRTVGSSDDTVIALHPSTGDRRDRRMTRSLLGRNPGDDAA